MAKKRVAGAQNLVPQDRAPTETNLNSEQKRGRLAKGLNELGLDASHLPGFLLSMVPALASVELLIHAIGGLRQLDAALTPNTAFLTHLLLAYAVAMTFYTLGDLWDERVFDRLYSVNGRLLGLGPGRLLLAFKPGTELRDVRREAASLHNEGKEDGALAASRTFLNQAGESLEQADRYNNSSKFCRTFILPLLLAALVAFGLAIAPGELRWTLLGAGGLAIVGAAIMFLLYVNQRVEFMIEIYRKAVKIAGAQADSGGASRAASPPSRQQVPATTRRN